MRARSKSFIDLFVFDTNTRKDSTYEKQIINYIDPGNRVPVDAYYIPGHGRNKFS